MAAFELHPLKLVSPLPAQLRSVCELVGRGLNVSFWQKLPFGMSHAYDGFVPILVVRRS